jgi:beta-lactamase regulating signal transducer with metallopeptidase domain
MWFDGSLASLSIGITYLLQVFCGYLATLAICAFVRNARARVRLWGGFLFLTIAAWVSLWIPARVSGLFYYYALRFVPSLSTGALHVAIPVEDSRASYVARLAPMATYLYVFLLLMAVVHLLFQSAKLKAVLRRTEPPSHELELRFRYLCHELDIARCDLGLASELRSPATCYWWRTHVLLPTELVPLLDGDQLDDVLRHELVHVRQKDYLWDRLAALGCRLVFFHPLVWLGYRHLRWERELACDHAVVRECSEARLRYAECLTTLAHWLIERKNPSSGISFFSSESLLAVRVRSLLKEPSVISAPQTAARTGLVAMGVSVALLLIPSVGLSIHSTIHLADLMARGNVRSNSPRKKAGGGKPARSFRARAAAAGTPWMSSQPTPRPINALLNSLPQALPVLNSSAAQGSADTPSVYIDEDVRLRNSHAIWDEGPMPLATAPKWRNLAIGAITGAVGMAAGRIDVDDIDGPRKRSR